MSNDRLVYGKNDLQRIVSIEAVEDQLHIFRETEQGINIEYAPNKYWILASYPLDDGWVKLRGDLHYQYGKQFTSRSEFTQAKQQYKGCDIYSIYDPKESAMVRYGYTYFKGMRQDEVSVLAFDIEATGLEHNEDSRVLLIANTFRRNGVVTRKLFSYNEYKTQGAMLTAWCEWVREQNPSVICGHNIFTYDLPYMQYVASEEGVTLDLGRDGSAIRFEPFESRFRKDASMFYHYHKARIFGRELVDTMFTAVKYDVGRKYESYKLKEIIRAEGKEVEGRVFYDASKIRANYQIPEEWEKIKQYSIFDGDDALTLFDLMIPAFFYMTQAIPKSFQSVMESASGSQINSIMIRAYFQDSHSIPKAEMGAEFEGATSLGNPGIYRNVFKVDVASLYPNIMLQYEVYDRNKDPEAKMLQMLKTFTDRRIEYKKIAKETGNKHYDDLQNAFKIFINSVYGFLGAPGLNFNYMDGAAFVTQQGRKILDTAIQWSTRHGFTLVNADTDSISFCLPDGGEIPKDKQTELLADLNKLFPERIKFENDGYYLTVIVVKIKNYILWDGKKLKYKGSAIKASTKEPALKQFIKDIIQCIIDNRTDYQAVYGKYVLEILNVKDITRWASRKTITDKVLKGERTNETKVKDAIENSEYVEGDRAHFYFKEDESLGLVENFDGKYNVNRLLKKLFDTSKVFSTVLDTKSLFVNYTLKKNSNLLQKMM